MDELKPCPFCGGEAELSDAGWKCKDQQKRYIARCSKCWTRRCVKPLPANQAIEEWNKRTADVAEVKHGHWERGWDNGNIYAYCTACKRRMDYHCYGYAHCPHCGARMDGKE